MGFVDLHLHLLPAVDDGPRTMEESVAMAKALVRLGFDVVAPSPHHRPQYASYSRAVCEAGLVSLRSALAEEGVSLELLRSAEHDFLEARLLEDAAAGCIGASRVLLVEAPYVGPLPAVTELVFRLRLQRIVPLIAHPERCAEFVRRGRAAELVAAGAKLQLDLGSLIGRYGRVAERLARDWLGDGLYAVAGTDAHGPEGLEAWVRRALEVLAREGGPEAVTRLLDAGPRALVSATL